MDVRMNEEITIELGLLVIGLAVAGAYARSDDGFSSVSRSEDSLGNYQFGYDITDWDTNQKRWEVSDAHNNRKGGYSITDVDGKVRHLEYVADKAGFRAVIRTNEPGTAPGYSGDALYLREGVKQILTGAQPALQFTGHVLKQKKLAAAHPIVPVAQVPVAVPVAKPVVYQQPIAQPIHVAKPVVYQQPLVKPALQVYQNVQPIVPVAPKPVLVQQPLVHYQRPVAVQQPVVQYTKPLVQYQQHLPIARPVVYQRPFVQSVQIAKPVVYQQPLTKVHFQTYQQIQPVVVSQPKVIAPAPVVITKPIQVPAVQKLTIAQPVVVKQKKIIVTPPPAYSGPRRRPQKLIEDPSQAYETPELPKLTPKRVPGYNPGLDDFEDDYDPITVAPPLSRGRVAYSPDGRDLAISKFSPLYIKAGGITRKSGSFPPLAGPPSRRARA